MSEQLTTIGITALAFLCGYLVCWFLTERKISEAYEDGLMDGSISTDATQEEINKWKSNSSSI